MVFFHFFLFSNFPLFFLVPLTIAFANELLIDSLIECWLVDSCCCQSVRLYVRLVPLLLFFNYSLRQKESKSKYHDKSRKRNKKGN